MTRCLFFRTGHGKSSRWLFWFCFLGISSGMESILTQRTEALSNNTALNVWNPCGHNCCDRRAYSLSQANSCAAFPSTGSIYHQLSLMPLVASHRGRKALRQVQDDRAAFTKAEYRIPPGTNPLPSHDAYLCLCRMWNDRARLYPRGMRIVSPPARMLACLERLLFRIFRLFRSAVKDSSRISPSR